VAPFIRYFKDKLFSAAIPNFLRRPIT